MALGWHLNFRLRDNRVIAPGVPARRRVARSFLTIGGRYGMLAFRVVARHGHGAFVCRRNEAGAAAQAIGSSITQALGIPSGFAETWMEPIGSQHKLEEVFGYVLGQADHHAVFDDPLHDGSALPDLLGMRHLGTGVIARVRRHLPDVGRDDLLVHLGVGLRDAFAPEHLADAAAATLALPSLRGRTEAHVLARTAAVHAAGDRLSAGGLADALGVGLSTVRQLRARPRRKDLVAAVLRGLALRAALGDRLHVEREIPAGSRRRRR